jgi:hypothetical protein
MTDNCSSGFSLKSPFKERVKGLWIMNVTITRGILSDSIALLPPTSPTSYSNLSDQKEKNYLFLYEGSGYVEMPEWYETMTDKMLLTFKTFRTGELLICQIALVLHRIRLLVLSKVDY